MIDYVRDKRLVSIVIRFTYSIEMSTCYSNTKSFG